MDKRGSRFIIVCAICLIMSALTNVYAGTIENQEEAIFLDEIGLFKGTDSGYSLEKSSDRQQAAVMIVRLMGKEEEALEHHYTHPFADVDGWAAPYVGYLYHYKITAGKGNNLYGVSEQLSASQYMTFLLRVAGYNDAEGDFRWDKSIDKAKELGFFTEQDYMDYHQNNCFLRDDLVYFTYKALMCTVKNENEALLKQLIDEGVVEGRGLYDYTIVPYMKADYTKIARNREELAWQIAKIIYNFDNDVTVDIRNVTIDEIYLLMSEVQELITVTPGLLSCMSSWSVVLENTEMTLSFEYLIEKEQFDLGINRGAEIVDSLIASDMTDFEKELEIHDYIINNTQYDRGEMIAGASYTLYGVLGNNTAVCQGYADTFHYLASLAGIESEVIIGDVGDVGHAWNLIKLDGQCYHVDTTWDDPVSEDSEGTLQYTYFNVTDSVISKNHIWEETDYQKCNHTTYNYHEYYNRVVYGKGELTERIMTGIKQKEEVINVIVKDYSINNFILEEILSDIEGYKNAYFSTNEITGEVNVELTY